MKLDITSRVDDDVLIVTFSGEFIEADAVPMMQRYFDVVLASRMKKVLVDIRPLRGRPSMSATYFLMRNLPVVPVPPGIKTVVVDRPELRSFVEFLETTAANAGVQLTHFVDYDQARASLAR